MRSNGHTDAQPHQSKTIAATTSTIGRLNETAGAGTETGLGVSREGRTLSRYYLMKRTLDLVLALGSIIVLSPLLALVAILIKLETPGPVIFRQERMGYDWRRRRQHPFKVCKFRSMYENCDQSVHQELVRNWIHGRDHSSASSGDGLVKLTRDSRVTRIGGIIRVTSIDELPQLWNVLKGEMSLVGPRPVPLYEVSEYEPWHRRRLEALPGITGPWQVHGRGLVSLDEMARLDIEYVERQSIWLDLKIMLQTVPVVLSRRGAV